MGSKKIQKRKKTILKNLDTLFPKNLNFNKIKIKINPVEIIDDTKNKIDNFYINFKKEKEKEKKRLEKKRNFNEKRELQKEKKLA